MMLTLFLDFASHQKMIGLIKDKRTIGLEPINDHANESALMPMIERMMNCANEQRANERTSNVRSIDRIAAVTGPGGFMSQRVGLAIANALSWSLKIPSAGIHLSDLWHARAQNSKLPPSPAGYGRASKTQNCFWIHSTKKQLLFIRGLGKYADTWPEPVLITLDELKTVTEGQYVGEVLDEQAAVLQIKPLTKLKEVSEVLPAVLETLRYKKTPLTPWYGRGA